MLTEERYKSIPHVELIEKDGSVTIPSIFMFRDGTEEYYSFLRVCRAYNCTVHFENENMTVPPTEGDIARNMKEMMYFQMASCPEMVEQYLRFLLNSDKMSWDAVEGQHEAIL